MDSQEYRIILIPGNGGGSVKNFWFLSIKEELEKLNLTVILEDFPDPILAQKKIWLPFIQKLGVDKKTILIGHSSGAVAAMRFAEENIFFGSILVAAYHTDLGNPIEKQSGYFDTPWQWGRVRENQEWIVQFASADDPFVPISEARFVHEKLHSEYYEYLDQGHFSGLEQKKTFPAVVEVVQKKLDVQKGKTII